MYLLGSMPSGMLVSELLGFTFECGVGLNPL